MRFSARTLLIITAGVAVAIPLFAKYPLFSGQSYRPIRLHRFGCRDQLHPTIGLNQRRILADDPRPGSLGKMPAAGSVFAETKA
mgnify:CR=1 FL=1